jgi:hypothetical protein
MSYKKYDINLFLDPCGVKYATWLDPEDIQRVRQVPHAATTAVTLPPYRVSTQRWLPVRSESSKLNERIPRKFRVK